MATTGEYYDYRRDFSNHLYEKIAEIVNNELIGDFQLWKGKHPDTDLTEAKRIVADSMLQLFLLADEVDDVCIRLQNLFDDSEDDDTEDTETAGGETENSEDTDNE